MSTPLSIQGVALGTGLAFADGTSLSAFEVGQVVALGTTVYRSDNDTYYQLKVSATGPDGTHLAVAGFSGLRWVAQAAVAGVTSVAVAGNLATSGSTGALTLTGPDTGTLVTELSATATDWDFATGLTGDTDGDYQVRGHILVPNSSALLSIQLNGAAPSAFHGAYAFINGSALTASADQTSCFIGNDSSGASLDFEIYVQSKSGRNRFMTGRWMGSGNIPTTFNYINRDTAVVITSLRLHSSTSGGILVNSFITYRKLGFTA